MQITFQQAGICISPSYSSERLLRVLNSARLLTVLYKICHKENSEFEQRTIQALSQDFDATELWRARASSETIDLRTLEFGPNYFQSPYTTSERVTCISMSLQ